MITMSPCKDSSPARGAPTELNGVPLDELERDMRPRAMSVAGFLGPNESLLEVLAADDAKVRALGTTHRALAAALREVVSLTQSSPAGVPVRVQAGGETLVVTVKQWNGMQRSPFRDGTSATCDVTVQRLVTGRSLTFSELIPEMVARYGFYEGHGTPYRVDPAAIVDVLSPLLAASLRPLRGCA